MQNKILHIATGGTIEGVAPEYKEVGFLADVFSDVSMIEKYMVNSFKLGIDYEFVQVCKKDSRDVSKMDRKNVLEKILESYAKGVRLFLITHGTYTMSETGVFLKNNLPKELLDDCSIVITGAMYPINIVGSDGLLNIGASVSSLMNMEKLGVKISMHGLNWDPENVRKDKENLIFTSKG